MAEKTRYHVFAEDRDASGAAAYLPLEAYVEAHSAVDAIRKSAKKSGVYVAVPARSFEPTTVTIETQTVVKVGGAA